MTEILPPTFGDHPACQEVRWCEATALDAPTAYKYKGLPRHKPLESPDLKKDLQEVFKKYESQADKLSHLGSSQANESLNNAISRKAPKSSHFSGSGALYSRVCAAVAEKNEGSGYLVQVSFLYTA